MSSSSQWCGLSPPDSLQLHAGALRPVADRSINTMMLGKRLRNNVGFDQMGEFVRGQTQQTPKDRLVGLAELSCRGPHLTRRGV